MIKTPAKRSLALGRVYRLLEPGPAVLLTTASGVGTTSSRPSR